MNDRIDDIVAALPPTPDLHLIVDFDGTLSEIVATPDLAVPVEGARDVLHRLGHVCPVAVVSGRPVRDLRRRLDPEDHLTLAGGHGTEVVHPDGTEDALVDPADVKDVLDAVEQALQDVLDVSLGWLVERKPASIAVHHRQVADPGQTLLKVRRVLDDHANHPPGFVVSDGKAVTELRPAGVTKGTVVERLAAAEPGRHMVVIGDDVTDEDAFRAAVALGGTTVVVADDGRESAAAFRLAGPENVVHLLQAIADRAP
jgi:trehalose-phosphatase